MPCLNEISLRLTALSLEKTAMSARAITAYLDLVLSFIIVYLRDLYIYPTKIVKFLKLKRLAFCHSVMINKVFL